MRPTRTTLLVVLLLTLAPSCNRSDEKRAGDVSAWNDGTDSDAFLDANAIVDADADAFLARRAEYLAFCVESSAPGGNNSIHGQGCRVAAGESELDDGAIERNIERLDDRLDTADFGANGLVRLLYLDDATGTLGDTRRARIEDTLLEFKYWLDEPDDDGMAYWTENHQILFHTVELLVGQRFVDTTV